MADTETTIDGPTEEQQRTQAILDIASDQCLFNDECELDETIAISEGDDNGAFVRAWVWVSFDGTSLDKDADDDEEAAT